MYVNGVFVGLYFMHEVIDEAFFDTRLKNDDGSGNAMKLYYDVTLQYFGSDDTYYKDKAHVNDLGVSMYYYEQSQGNGNWTGFIDLLSFFNNSSDETFAIELSNRVDTTSLLKNMV
jgi:spore coat protein CotH